MINTIYIFEEKMDGLIAKKAKSFEGSLEEYLRSILICADLGKNQTVDFNLIYGILDKGFDEQPAEFKEQWLEIKRPVAIDKVEDTYECFLSTILFQIADLRRMKDAGEFENENRYFGSKSPTGNSWYNFDVCSYLGCGVRGLIDHCKIGNFNDTEAGWDLFVGLLELGRLYE